MSSGRHDESSRGEEEVAAMTAAAMLLRGLRAADDATRSDGGVADDVTRAGSNYGGKGHDWVVNVATKAGGG
jgi:hypothetical protein